MLFVTKHEKGFAHLLPVFVIAFLVGGLILTIHLAKKRQDTRSYAYTTLNGRTVQKDASGKIVSWVTPQNVAYDTILRDTWDFLLNGVPTGCNGLKHYQMQSYLFPSDLSPSGWQNNPAGKNAMFVESALADYAYSGDSRVITFAKEVADYQLVHGMTASADNWSNVPYASGTACDVDYRGSGPDGDGNIEPDKIGEFGLQILRLYEFTGDTRYRDAAINGANALVSHVRTGSNSVSPWAFRVNPQNNAVADNYSADVIAPIKLFDELIRLNLGNVGAYQSARQTAWNWLMNFPMKNNTWDGYFEDYPSTPPGGNNNQYNPGETARYFLMYPQTNPNWQADTQKLITFIEQRFGHFEDGGYAIKEQDGFANVMGSHTSRYASINALYYEATGDTAAKEKAFRAFNWATYMADTANNRNLKGVNVDGDNPHQVWFTDGYGDYIRHFMAGLGAVPEWAPATQSHLLRSTSVVKAVSYSSSQISYSTFDKAATEVLRVTNPPTKIIADGVTLQLRTDLNQDGYTFDSAFNVVRIRHTNANDIVLEGNFTVATPPPSPSPTPTPMPTPPGQGIVDFNNGPTGPLNGQYPAGVINWGSGTWLLSGPFGGFTDNSVSFSGAGITTGTFTFLTPNKLVSLDAYNGGTGTSTVTLACSGQPTKQFSVAQQPLRMTTGWVGTCTTVTVTSSNGWDTNFDNLVYDASGATPTPTPTPTVQPSPSPTATPCAKVGDFDNDCDVDIVDLSFMLSFYRAGDLRADLNHDGRLSIADFSVFASGYGK